MCSYNNLSLNPLKVQKKYTVFNKNDIYTFFIKLILDDSSVLIKVEDIELYVKHFINLLF